MSALRKSGHLPSCRIMVGARGWELLCFSPRCPETVHGATVALTALELLVAFLQAYVFAILTCIYLNDALHAGH
jgi:F0F1-type ATP synthase membrane subunit a